MGFQVWDAPTIIGAVRSGASRPVPALRLGGLGVGARRRFVRGAEPRWHYSWVVRCWICGLLLAGCVGCNAKPSEDDTPPRSEPWLNPLAAQSSAPVVGPSTDYHRANETVELPHYKIALGAIKTCTIEPYLKPKAGSTVLGVEVVITGRGPAQVPSNPFYATLVARDGTRHAATLAGCKPELKATSLDSGDSSRGFISFVVPAAQLPEQSPEQLNGWKLLYRPAIIGATEEEARFDLGR